MMLGIAINDTSSAQPVLYHYGWVFVKFFGLVCFSKFMQLNVKTLRLYFSSSFFYVALLRAH